MNKQQLAAKIWESANTMRSKIEANEYKDYILGFIFYKFLSEGLERFLADNDVTREELPEVLVETDRDMVHYCQDSLGYFMAYDHLYSTWLAKGNDFNVADVRDALSAFERLIAPSQAALFKGIFDTLTTGLSKLGDSSTSQTKAVKDLLVLIRDIPMDARQDYDVLGFIYEYLIANFAANAGKKAGEFYTPHEVSQLMSRIIADHLSDREQIQIYDPTSGSGSLLLNIGQAVSRHMDEPDKIKYFAQELKAPTYNLTRMNLIMRGIKPHNIVTRNADTLEQDWPIFDEQDPINTYQTLYVDAVVSNPPYSQRWDPKGHESDPRYARFGMAPDSKADYAFLLHDLYHVKPDGIMTIVLPHGVLFRGGSEAVIRKELIEQNHIDAIIGLPANIFFGTGIPTIIMVLKQKRDRDDVLFIDASLGFKKVGKNNMLRASDIRRIGDAVQHRWDIERFSRVVTRDEIRDNDYNLNIPRYVSAAPPAEPVDLYATMYGGIPDAELDTLAEYWEQLPGLREALFTATSPGYSKIVVEDLQLAIEQHPSVAAFQARVPAALDGLHEHLHETLVNGRASVHVRHAAEELVQDLFARFSPVPLVDAHDAYQLHHDHWTVVANDLEIVQTEGDQAVRTVDPTMVMKKVKGKSTEVQDGWHGRVLPYELVQAHLLPHEAAHVASLQQRIASAEEEVASIIEGLSEEDRADLTGVLNEDGDAFAKTALTREVKLLTKGRQTWPEDSTEALQIRANSVLNDLAAAKKELKAAAADFETSTRNAIESLSDSELEQLLVAKWVDPLVDQLLELPSGVLDRLEQKIQALHNKYAVDMLGLSQTISKSERTLGAMLANLSGEKSDGEALEALRLLLEVDHD